MKILVAVKRVIDFNVKPRVKMDGSGQRTSSMGLRSDGFGLYPACCGSCSRPRHQSANASAGSGPVSTSGPLSLPIATQPAAGVAPGDAEKDGVNNGENFVAPLGKVKLGTVILPRSGGGVVGPFDAHDRDV